MALYTMSVAPTQRSASGLQALRDQLQLPQTFYKVRRRLQTAYHGYEVNYAFNMLTLTEKVIAHTFVLIVMSLLLTAIVFWIPRVLLRFCFALPGCTAWLKNAQLSRDVANALATATQVAATSIVRMGQPTGAYNGTASMQEI